MNLQEWREKQRQGEAFELPSGLVVRLRRVGLLDLLSQGSVPAPLVGMVQMLIEKANHQLGAEQFPQFAQSIDLVVKAAMVDPPVADAPGEGVLGIGELSIADRLAVFAWANAPAEELRPFRPAAS